MSRWWEWNTKFCCQTNFHREQKVRLSFLCGIQNAIKISGPKRSISISDKLTCFSRLRCPFTEETWPLSTCLMPNLSVSFNGADTLLQQVCMAATHYFQMQRKRGKEGYVKNDRKPIFIWHLFCDVSKTWVKVVFRVQMTSNFRYTLTEIGDMLKKTESQF